MAREIDNVKYNEEFINSSSGVKLFTCSWIPLNREPKALIFICHGYAMECSITMNSTGIRLAEAGYACYGIDYKGHGKSEGLQAYIDNFQELVDDCSDHFTSISEKKENTRKMRYLMGESMGGAMALLLHRKKPEYFHGAVLSAPMCKIAEEMKPHPVAITFLTQLSKLIPTWRLVPAQDIIDVAFKQPEVRKQIRENPYCYKGRPRLKTAHQLYTISMDLEQRLHQVSLPLLILHGDADKVTDKATSKLLYDVASSNDKTLKLYPEMWHGLLYGEPLENINVVFVDIIGWLDERVSSENSRLENEQKLDNDDLKSMM